MSPKAQIHLSHSVTIPNQNSLFGVHAPTLMCYLMCYLMCRAERR